jgi:hypothetical protein
VLGKLLAQLLPGRRPPPPDFSFIICSVDDARFACVQASIEERFAGASYELIRITNAKSLAEGYNRGMKSSRGGMLIFCHDDIEFLQPDIATRIVDNLKHFDLVGVAGTTRLVDGYWGSVGQPEIFGQVVQPDKEGEGITLYVFDIDNAPATNVQGLDGLFLAVRRPVAEALRFDEVNFTGFHLYDTDFCYRAHLGGYKVGVCRDVLILHYSHGDKNEDWQRYMAVFAHKYRDRLSGGSPVGQQMMLTVKLPNKESAVPSFDNLRRNPPLKMEWSSPPQT